MSLSGSWCWPDVKTQLLIWMFTTCRCAKEFIVSKRILNVKRVEKKTLNCFTLTGFCNEMEFSPHPSHSNAQSLGLSLSLPLSFMARWPWHLTVPPSDMPRCQEFSSSEICTTTNRILYNLDDSHSRGQKKPEKEADWGSALRGRGGWKSQSKIWLLSKIPPCSSSEMWGEIVFCMY